MTHARDALLPVRPCIARGGSPLVSPCLVAVRTPSCGLAAGGARIAMAARHPEQCVSRTPVPGSHCASCDADPWCGWHFVRVWRRDEDIAPYRILPPRNSPYPSSRGAVPLHAHCPSVPLRGAPSKTLKILYAPIHPAPSLFVLLCVKNTRTPQPNPASRPRCRAPWCGPVAVERDVIARGGSPLAPPDNVRANFAGVMAVVKKVSNCIF